jgi:hypothetical protein
MGEYISQKSSSEEFSNEKQFLRKQKENEFRIKNLEKSKEEIKEINLKKYINYKHWIIAAIVALFLLLLSVFLFS